MSADLIIHLLFRFIHIGSVIMLLGGVFYARQVLVPAFNLLPSELRMQSAVAAQARWRTTLFLLLILIVGSGLYNFFAYTGPKHTATYQMWFGIKILLVAHICATAILSATSNYGDVAVEGKGKHRLVSVTIAGFVVVLISSYLRSLSLRGM